MCGSFTIENQLRNHLSLLSSQSEVWSPAKLVINCFLYKKAAIDSLEEIICYCLPRVLLFLLLFLFFKKFRNLLRLEFLSKGDSMRWPDIICTLDGCPLVQREGDLPLPVPPAGSHDTEPQYEASHHVLVIGQGKTQGLFDKLAEVQHCTIFTTNRILF